MQLNSDYEAYSQHPALSTQLGCRLTMPILLRVHYTPRQAKPHDVLLDRLLCIQAHEAAWTTPSASVERHCRESAR